MQVKCRRISKLDIYYVYHIVVSFKVCNIVSNLNLTEESKANAEDYF